MVFECANYTFRWIGMVIVGIGELILEIFCGDGRTDAVGDFIVEFVKDRIDSRILQFGVTSIVALDEVFCLSTFDWVNEDCIGVMIV